MSLSYFADYEDYYEGDDFFEDHLKPWSDEPIEDGFVEDFWDEESDFIFFKEKGGEEWELNFDTHEDIEAYRRMMFGIERREGALWKNEFKRQRGEEGLKEYRRKTHRSGFDSDPRKLWRRNGPFRAWYSQIDWIGHMDWHMDEKSVLDQLNLEQIRRDNWFHGSIFDENDETDFQTIENATFEERMALDWDIDREAQRISDGGVYREPDSYYDLLDSD